MNVYEIITEKIIEKLQAGTIPWHKPWTSTGPVNWVSGKRYNGINRLLLDGGEYLTFKQVQDAGGTVKKGSKGHIIVFYKMVQKDDEEKTSFPMLRYYTVFHLSQCDGIASKIKISGRPAKNISNDVIDSYLTREKITLDRSGSEAYYTPCTDSITMPTPELWNDEKEYIPTLYHEIVHSTGVTKRLNRDMGMLKIQYGKEELVAELGASFLCAATGIDNTLDNSAAYIASWLNAIKKDSKILISAGAAAQKAADYILG